MQNNVIAFEDYAWGDGEIFTDYRCSPGVVVDKYQEGDRWSILIEGGANYGLKPIQKGGDHGKNNIGAATVLAGISYSLGKQDRATKEH